MELNKIDLNLEMLTIEQLEQIDGGFAPLVIGAIKLIGAGILGGAGWYAGEAAANHIFN